MLIIVIVQIIWAGCNAMTNLWLVFWTDSYAPGSTLTYGLDFYIVGYIIFGFLYAFVAYIRALLIANSSPKMSDLIHESMISNLLFSSLNEFFDRVPLGRIFNRVSKDLNSVDMNVSVALNSTLVFCFFLVSVIVTICVCGMYYIFLPIIVVYIGSCHFLRMYYTKAASELTKIEGITKSPIVSCFTEILSGVATIRSYKKESMFIHNNCMKIDENKKPIMARKAVEVWFTLRLMLLSFMMAFTGLAYSLFWPTGNTPADLY
jgi:ATP-binding cassette subfamily C (CFTR/MRP) protein 1